MKRQKKRNTLFQNTDGAIKREAEVIKIAPNICMEKGVCQSCSRGDKYGIPLHFILHLEDASIKTVCYACGKRKSDEIGLKLPLTESDIFAGESEADLRLIRIARHKRDAKNGNIQR